MDPTNPLLVVYVVWHPAYLQGAEIADALRGHFRRQLYDNVAGGTGLSVIYRSAHAPEAVVPLPIDLNEARTTAVIVLADRHLATDLAWKSYLKTLVDETDSAGLHARLFPVAMEPGVLAELQLQEQAVRWDRWQDTDDRPARLKAALTYEFCRMLRHYLERLRHPLEDEVALEAYLKRVEIFLSHSKHDPDGERIALAIRDWLFRSSGLASFFDVHDIPAGVKFNEVLLQKVRVSAMVAVHTDTYSSREWCRREILEAKRANVPLVVASCISDVDERGFPYLGNVPVVRLDPAKLDRIETVIARLLDEVLKDFLWRCRIELLREPGTPAALFLPRPPELISLAGVVRDAAGGGRLIVYPDPPLSSEEERLFADIAPDVQLRSMTEWLAGAVR